MRCAQVLQVYAAIRPRGLRTPHNLTSHVLDKIAKKNRKRLNGGTVPPFKMPLTVVYVVLAWPQKC